MKSIDYSTYTTLSITRRGPHDSVLDIQMKARNGKLPTAGHDGHEELCEIWRDVGRDDSVRCAVLRGEGMGFSGGGDLNLVQDMAERITLNRTGAVKDYYLRDAVGVNGVCTVPPAPPAGAVPGFAAGAFDLANTDVCEWHALVRQAMGQPGAELARVRGCISATGNAGELLVSLVFLNR